MSVAVLRLLRKAWVCALLVAALACSRSHGAEAESRRADRAEAGAVATGADGQTSMAPSALDGGPSSDVPRRSEEDEDALARRFLQECRRARCDLAVRCEGTTDDIARAQAECHPAFAETLNAPILDRVALGTLAFDATHAAQILDTIDGLADCPFAMGVMPETCTAAFVGVVPEGGACTQVRWSTLRDECEPGSHCVVSDACPGHCEPRRPDGAPCVEAAECVESALCHEGACRVAAAIGESCEGRPCETLTGCIDGVCRDPAVLHEGERCDVSDLWCLDELLCLPVLGDDPSDTEFRCVDVDVSGAPCGHDLGWPSTCSSSRVCEPIAGQSWAGVCTDGLPAGAVCTDGVRCAAGSRCVDGLCRDVVGPSDACDLEHRCPWSHECRRGVCTPLPMLGESCASSGRCAEGRCIDGRCRRLPDGEGCNGTDWVPFGECDGYCNGYDQGWCGPIEPEGGACTMDEACPAGMACVAPEGGFVAWEGVCQRTCA